MHITPSFLRLAGAINAPTSEILLITSVFKYSEGQQLNYPSGRAWAVAHAPQSSPDLHWGPRTSP